MVAACIDWALLPVFYVATFALAGVALWAGVSEAMVLAIVTAWTAAFVALAERLRPLRFDWMRGDGEFKEDGLHFVFGFALGALGASAVAEWWGVQVWGVWFTGVKAPWPTAWPWQGQLALAFAIAELTGYLHHRALHRVPALWRFHAIHHEPRRLTVIKTTRIHFVDIGSATLLNLGMLVSLGCPARIVFWFNAFTNVTALVQHGNVRWRTPRWLDALVCTPAVHQSHHAREPALGNANFATNLPLWDHVFGTFRGPVVATPSEVGLLDESDRPATFLAQISAPFFPRRLSR